MFYSNEKSFNIPRYWAFAIPIVYFDDKNIWGFHTAFFLYVKEIYSFLQSTQSQPYQVQLSKHNQPLESFQVEQPGQYQPYQVPGQYQPPLSFQVQHPFQYQPY